MRTKPVLTTVDIDKLLAGARKKAEANSWAVGIVVVDDGGHLIGAIRVGDAAVIAVESARLKARTSAMMKAPTAYLTGAVKESLAILSIPEVMLLPGGMPIVADGSVVGGIGVAGAMPDQDVEAAQAGLATLA